MCAEVEGNLFTGIRVWVDGEFSWGTFVDLDHDTIPAGILVRIDADGVVVNAHHKQIYGAIKGRGVDSEEGEHECEDYLEAVVEVCTICGKEFTS